MDELIARQETWVICVEHEVAGMLTVSDSSIDQLYLTPSRRGQGLGDLLVAHAKMRHPAGLGLWTFQVNSAALQFYARHRFREALRTDGSNNEEREPDVRMEWTPFADEHTSPAS